MRVVLYAVRVKGGCVLWVRYPKDNSNITRREKNSVILSSERNLPEDDPGHVEYKKFIGEMIARIRSAGLTLLNEKEFASEEKAAETELEAV